MSRSTIRFANALTKALSQRISETLIFFQIQVGRINPTALE